MKTLVYVPIFCGSSETLVRIAKRRPIPEDIEKAVAIHIEAIKSWIASL